MSVNNYISILSGVGGVDLAKFNATGSSTSYDTKFQSAGADFWEANANVTNNVFSILPNASSADRIKIGTGPSNFHLLYKNNNTEISNITLSDNLSLTADGFLDVVGGPSAGSISVTTTSGSTFTNINQVRIDDSTGLLASNPVAGIAEVTYSNTIIYADQFVAFTSGFFPKTSTDVLDDAGASAITVITDDVDFYGRDIGTIVPPDRIPANYFNTQGLGTTIDIAGMGVAQFLPADPARKPQFQPFLPTTPLTTDPPPYGLSNVYNNPPLFQEDGYADPRPLYFGNYVNSVKPTALLNFYGDSGGPNPQPAPGGFAAMRWYTHNPNSVSLSGNEYLQAQRNFHYSPTFIETVTGSDGNLLPNDCIPDFPYISNVLEMRNYTGANVHAESYIGIKKKPTPISDDPDSNRWEWKVHEDYDIDMLPVYYGDGTVTGVVPSVTTANVINEVNKITHEITPGYSTQIKLASNYRTIGFSGEGGGNVMLEFAPSSSTTGDATKVPSGTTTFYQKGYQIWQTDADEFNVQLTKDATDPIEAALVSKGGLGVNKQSHLGDRLWLYSNTLDRCSILFRPSDLGIGAAEIQYSNVATSNVLSFQMPDVSTGTRILRNRLSLSSTYAQLGFDDPFCSIVKLQNKDGLGVQLFNGSVDIGRNALTDEIDFKVYSNALATQSTPILHATGSDVGTGDNYFVINHRHDTDVGPAFSINKSSIRSEIDINQSGNIPIWFDVKTGGGTTTPALRLTQTAHYFGLDSVTNNATFTIYSRNPNDNTATKRYRNIKIKEYLVRIGRQRLTNETHMVNIDGRAIEYFQADGVDQPESMNVFATTSNTIVAMSLNADSNVATANNYVQINPGQSGIVGFKSSTSNVADALVIGSEYARDSAKYGVPIVGVSNTSANHLTANYATPHGLVYSSDEDKYCYYNSNATTLTCLVTKGDVCLDEYTTYNDLYTWENSQGEGCMAFANVETTNLLSNVGKPDAEVANDSERIYTPTYTAPGTFLPPMMDTIIYHCWTEFPANNLGVDDIDGEPSPTAAGGRRLWQYEGENNIISSDKRLVFDRTFSYVDGAYIGFDMGESVVDNLPQANINVGGTTRSYTFRRQYAHKSGWISGVQLKPPGFVELQQGDTSWNGSNSQFKGFAALYLSNDYGNYSVSSIRNPGNVLRYLKKWQFTTNSDTEKITIEGIENIELPTEEWVYVEKGDQLPFIHFTYFAGTEDARIRMLSFDWSLSSENAFGRWWSANLLFTFKTPRLLNRYRGDQRWDLTNVPTS